MSRMAKVVAVLGVVAGLVGAMVPLSSYADGPEKVKFLATVGNNIGISASGELLEHGDLELGTMVAGGSALTSTIQVKVNTANMKGYTLMIRGADHDTNLYLETAEGYDMNYYIPAGDMKSADKSEWGYSVNGSSNFRAVTENAEEIVNASSNVQQVTSLTFAVKAGPGQHEGTYSGAVILTAAANN